MTSTLITPHNFTSEVLNSDKPIVLVVAIIDYGDYDDPNDDTLRFYNFSLDAFKSELQKTVGERYKIAIISELDARLVELKIPAVYYYPPPMGFTVYNKGERTYTGFLMGNSVEEFFQSLRNQITSFNC